MTEDKVYPKTAEELLEAQENFQPKTTVLVDKPIETETNAIIDESDALALEVASLEEDIFMLEKMEQEIIKPFYEEREAKMLRLIELKGVGHYFQNQESGIVLKTDTEKGQFVYNRPFVIKRTRFEGETKGSLSMTEARGQGFVVEGK